MAEAASSAGRTRTALQTGRERTRQWWRRAIGADGHERQVLLTVVKSALAATAAWVIARDVMQAQTPAFAPFSAVLIIQVTAYQSLLQALRYFGAVVTGVALQGVFGLLLGPNAAAFALVSLAALTIGRWRRLGYQGSNVPTAAFFAFSTYATATSSTQGLTQLGQIIALVAVGCGLGVLVNVVVLPPVRYRSAEYGVQILGDTLNNLVDDLQSELTQGRVEKEETERWRQRAERVGPVVQQARASAHTARESTYYNPHRLFSRSGKRPWFAGYEALIDAMERVSSQLASMTRSLDRGHDALDNEQGRRFLRCYGEFLACYGQVTELLSQVDEDRLTAQTRELGPITEKAEKCRERLVEEAENSPVPLSDPAQPYGLLLAEATRLLEEISHTRDVLQQTLGSDSGRLS